MNYAIRKTSPHTARIAFESKASLNTTKLPEIWRFFPSNWRRTTMRVGVVLGHEEGKTCALIVHVRANDLIGINAQHSGVEDFSWSYYRIDQAFQPLALDLPNRRLYSHECAEILHCHDTSTLDRFDMGDHSLRSFFAQQHPEWLQKIADRQILQWQCNKPDSFFLLAPQALVEREIPRCVEVAPFAALARFKHRLNKTQLALCVLRSPKGAVRFATDEIPPLLREVFLIDHAQEAMEYAANKLTDDELKLCAFVDSFAAFRCRGKMPPNRRAIMLANSYRYAFIANYGGSMADLQNEIRTSLIESVEQWLGCDPKGFGSILNGLEQHVGMHFDHATLTAMLEEMGPERGQPLADHIASRI